MKRKVFVSLGIILIVLVISILKWDDGDKNNVCIKDVSHDVKSSMEFPNEFILKGKGFVIEDELMRYPFRIRKCGDYVFVLDLHAEEHFCHIYNKEKLSNNKFKLRYNEEDI